MRSLQFGPLSRPLSLVAALAVAATLTTSCDDTETQPIGIRNLDRPSGITFACHGDVKLAGSTTAVKSAQPLASCRYRLTPVEDPDDDDEVVTATDTEGATPPGQEGVAAPYVYAFVLQTVPGSVALARILAQPPHVSNNPGLVEIRDADALVPGRNAIAVGSQPIAIATDRDGCHIATANAGSCDLSLLSVDAAVTSTSTEVERLAVTVGGEPLLARPAAMIAEPDGGTIGAACPARPEGLVYIAYPDCHAVAAVVMGTGEVIGAVKVGAAGAFELVADLATLDCPAQCGPTLEDVTAGPRPTSLYVATDGLGGARLVIGADNDNRLTVVELDADRRFASVAPAIALAPDIDGTSVAVIDLAVTAPIDMGGDSGEFPVGVGAGAFQFVYAVTTDGTVRVADILDVGAECDTQVDPRFVDDLTDVSLLSCFPVGDARTPARRAGARSPGVLLAGAGIPTAVEVSGFAQRVLPAVVAGASDNLIGWFAFVTTSNGLSHIINIDDDGYADFEDSETPLAIWIELAMAHQVRDRGAPRSATATKQFNTGTEDANGNDIFLDVPTCTANDPSGIISGPFVTSSGMTPVAAAGIDAKKFYTLPKLHQLTCDYGYENDELNPAHKEAPRVVPAVGYSAPAELRQQGWPDLRVVPDTERWLFTWEGLLSAGDAIDGPPIRVGAVEVGGTGMHLVDQGAPFCAVGVEEHDIAVLLGCNPAAGDAECGLGYTCYVHPDSTSGNGACLRTDQLDLLVGPCRDYLLSNRVFSITDPTTKELSLGERRRVLRTSPVDGCVDAAQCTALSAFEASLALPDDTISDDAQPDGFQYACEPDPTRAAGPPRCVMTCDEDHLCDEGSVCSNNYCVEGVVPPLQCVTGPQRYLLRAGDAFAVTGTVTGFLHRVIADETGACVENAAASPLLEGRMPLTPPPCPADPTDFSVNPCSTTVASQSETAATVLQGGVCTVPSPLPIVVRPDVPAIRFANPQMTIEVVDPWFEGDAVCRGDRAGGLGKIPVVTLGTQVGFAMQSGFVPQIMVGVSIFPVDIVRGPDAGLWIIDEGDQLPQSGGLSIRGQVLRFGEVYAAAGAVNFIQ